MNKVFQEDYFCWLTGRGDLLSEHFHSDEFEDPVSDIQKIAIDMIEILQHIRYKLRFPIKILTGYVHKTENNISCELEHYWGRAVKISTKDLTKLQRKNLLDELSLHFYVIGIASTFVYIDLSTETQRVWRYESE